MSDSTQHIDTISNSQAQKEVTANAYFDASSPASAFGRRASACNGLTMGFYGTPRWKIDGVAVTRANAAFALTASSTRYISINRAFSSFAEVASAFDPDKLALYKAVTDGSNVTSYEDHRDLHHFIRFQYSRVTQAMADANKTLTYEQAMCESITLTGALTALRDVVVPLVPRAWIIFANVTGGFGVRVIGASGTGITVADGKRAIVECDGTNVVRVTADV